MSSKDIYKQLQRLNLYYAVCTPNYNDFAPRRLTRRKRINRLLKMYYILKREEGRP